MSRYPKIGDRSNPYKSRVVQKLTLTGVVEEAKGFNENLKAVCMINRADAKGSDNKEAADIASEIPGLNYIDAPLGNRKAFRSAASQGLAVTENKPADPKAVKELKMLYKLLFDI